MTCFFKQDPAGNVPAQLMTEITRALDRMNEHKVELIYQLLMDNDLTALHAYAAKTDRIAQVSASPFAFSRYSSSRRLRDCRYSPSFAYITHPKTKYEHI